MRSYLSFSVLAVTLTLWCQGCLVNAADQTSTSAAAPDELGTIVVTARRREENAQTVPISLTALTQEQLDLRPSVDIGDLYQQVPGLTSFGEQGIRNNLVFNIRGQGQAYGTQFPSVIPYFAEVPLDRISTGFVYDLENIQVLKGPQGTLFGRNTDGGAVLVIPKAPTNEFGGFAELKLGDYRLNEYTGALNLPIKEDVLLFRAAFDIGRRAGFTRDVSSGAYLDNLHYDSFRGTLTFKPFTDFSNTTVASYYGADEHGTGVKLTYVSPAFLTGVFNAFGFPPAAVSHIVGQAQSDLARQNALGPWATFQDTNPLSERVYKVLSNITTFDITGSLRLKNIFGYINEQETQETDFDGSSQPFIVIEGSAPFFSTKRTTDELQLLGRSFNDKLSWVSGLYYDYTRPATPVDPTNVTELLVLRLHTPTVFLDTSRAAYAQGTYDLASLLPGLKFTGGVRYTRDHVSQNVTETLNGSCAGGFPSPSCTVRLGPADFHAVTYNVDLDYQLDPETFIYVANRKGYKSGGFNITFPSPNLALYQPEQLIDEEIGVKKDWHVGSAQARTNLDIFHGIYTNIQQSVSVAVNNEAFTYIANVPSAIVEGVDLDATILPIPALALDLKYTYTDAHYTKTVAAFDINNRFAATPRNQGTFGAHYTWHLGATGDLNAGGTYYFQSFEALNVEDATEHNSDEPGYTLVSLDGSWHQPFGSPLDVGFFMTNVTNRVYRVGVNDVDTALGVGASWYGAPRMYGVTFKYRFGGG